MQVPEAFGYVEDTIMRAATISPSSFPLFKHIKTILLLSPEAPTKSLLNWIQENNIQLVHLGYQMLGQASSWKPVPEEMIKEGLEILLNTKYHPILVMCTSGIHETGALLGCLRKCQGWNYNSIIFEYRSFAGNKSRYMIEQFIELFDVDLVVLPALLPNWFKQ